MTASDRSSVSLTRTAPSTATALPPHGLCIYRASRLEALLEPLDLLLQALPPAHPLAPQTVIAAHPGMRKWLTGALARKRGRDGIVANVEVGLTSRLVDLLAGSLLGESRSASTPYARERLRWRIQIAFDAVEHAELQVFLAGDDSARRRFQLADRLAQTFTQYIVYRPQWLKGWERGRDDFADNSFQPALWRALRASLPAPHRSELIEQLIARLADGAIDGLPGDPLHVFGPTHLPPGEFALLQALARHRPVVLYVPDPCRELWTDLPNRTQLVRHAVDAAFSSDSESAFLAGIGHPLLSAWGRMGQHFVLALNQSDALSDVRHWEDQRAAPAATAALLHRLQHSIRLLDPALLQDGRPGDPQADHSLRVHACHTRLRELEVLRDCLLRARLDDPSIQPSDIAVMAPDINAYVPLLPAVFGPPGRHAGPLPYHLADVPLARTHPLFDAFGHLLALPASRITAPEVAALLQIAPVARAFGLDAADIDTLSGWLQASRAAWGFDAAFRERFAVPPIREHTLAWAVERLLAGYLFGQDSAEPRAVVLPDCTALWPVDGVHGPGAAALGALDALLVELRRWIDDCASARRASAWSARLERLIDRLFRIDRSDPQQHEALALLQRIVQSIARDSADAGDPLLTFDVVRDLLAEQLDGVPERQPFLMGGVTFCGMVPQRSIPFRMIAVLGLNDGDYPRSVNDAGLNLMLRPGQRQLGDRDVRSEDRYLFLETLMSARDRLHLSWIGEGVRDGKPRNPAPPLAELLTFLDSQLAPDAAADDSAARPWLIRHPLQPFDPSYFGPDARRLFSFDRAMQRAHAGRPRPPFLPDAGEPDAGEPDAGERSLPADGVVGLPQLVGWYRDPARALLRHTLHISLDALDDDALAEDEPLQPKLPGIERCARRLLFDALLAGNTIPDTPPDWLRLSGMLPAGLLGNAAWQRERAAAELLWQLARSEPPFAAVPPPQRMPQAIRMDCAGWRIEGQLGDVFDGGASLWLLDAFPGKEEVDLGFRERIPLFLRWALLRLATPDTTSVHACVLHDDVDTGSWRMQFAHWSDRHRDAVQAADAAALARLRSDLQRRVERLVGLFASASTMPPMYFPKTSWASLDRNRPAAAAQAWVGDEHGERVVGERDFGPGYARLLSAERGFEPGSPELQAMQQIATMLHDCIDLSHEIDDER